MNARSLETITAPDELRAIARRKRLFHLQRIVWEMMFERDRNVTVQDHDDSEPAGLIAALRVCGHFVEQIEAIGRVEPLIFRIEGIDKKEYLVGFELMADGYRLFAERVETSTLAMTPEGWAWEVHQQTTLHGQAGYYEEMTLGPMSVDRAFLVGMSMVIGLMDDQADGDGDLLQPLIQQITPTTVELEAIEARAPTSTILLDDDLI